MPVSQPYVIVWDLDLTVGDFSALHQRGEDGGPVTVRTRPGLAEVLRRLAEADFVHVVLTLATPLYAETALRGAGLREFFARVDGLGQRTKGDAAGLGDTLGISAGERPHRMLFVGDHPLFDAPHDIRVLFHLEPYGLERPAEELLRLVLHLREAGAGSLRRGFERIGGQQAGWRRLLPLRYRLPPDQTVRRCLPGIGDLLLVRCTDRSPVIGFENRPGPGVPACEHCFAPHEIMAPLQAAYRKD
jgi:hypothetical protein